MGFGYCGWLLAIGYWLLAIRYSLFAFGLRFEALRLCGFARKNLLAFGFSLFAFRDSLFGAGSIQNFVEAIPK